MRVAFVVPYPKGKVASQRFRFEQYISLLQNNGYRVSFFPYYSHNAFKRFRTGNIVTKALTVLYNYVKRLLLLFYIFPYDFIFIHREATPVGPPVFEWIVAAVFKKKIIYDFDDAIWTTDDLDESRFSKFFRWRKKVARICAWSHKVSVGNEYLASYAGQFNNQVIVNPTTIDTDRAHVPEKEIQTSGEYINKNVVVGWTGTHSTLKYLEGIYSILKQIEESFPCVSFLVIADRQPNLMLKKLIFKPWKAESEIDDLRLIDIGIMPLPDDEWTKGKCGFKALQYMALEIPSVVSGVGVNTAIIQNGVNGYLCTTHEDWLNALKKLISDAALRTRFGKEGRQTVLTRYSVSANASNFLSLFQ